MKGIRSWRNAEPMPKPLCIKKEKFSSSVIFFFKTRDSKFSINSSFPLNTHLFSLRSHSPSLLFTCYVLQQWAHLPTTPTPGYLTCKGKVDEVPVSRKHSLSDADGANNKNRKGDKEEVEGLWDRRVPHACDGQQEANGNRASQEWCGKVWRTSAKTFVY